MTALVVLDMAGTTIDDRDEVYRVLREATERFGADYTDAQFQQWMGTEKRWAIANLLKIGGVEPDEAMLEEAWRWFRAELRRTYEEQPPTALPGVEDALHRLQSAGVKVGLTTGFSREIAEIILGGLGWLENGLVDVLVAGDEVPAGRPEPYLIREVMVRTGVTDRLAVVSAGDTEADVESARRAEVYSVGVLTGHLSRADFESHGADLVLDSAADLPERLPQSAGVGVTA